MKENTALTVVERASLALGAGEHEKRLIELAQQSKAIVAITNPDGYKECHAARMALKTERVALAKLGKDARDDATKFSKAIIEEEKRLIAIIEPEESRLQAIQDAHDAEVERIKLEEAQREAVRIQTIQNHISRIVGLPGLSVGKMSSVIQDEIALLTEDDPATWAEEFLPIAADAKQKAIDTLTLMIAGAKAQEEAKAAEDARILAEREELARLRKEQEERARQDREAAARREEEDRKIREAREIEERRQQAVRDEEAARVREEQTKEAKRLEEQRKELDRRQAEIDAATAKVVPFPAPAAVPMPTIDMTMPAAEIIRSVNSGLAPQPDSARFDLRARIDDQLDKLGENDLRLVLNYIASLYP